VGTVWTFLSPARAGEAESCREAPETRGYWLLLTDKKAANVNTTPPLSFNVLINP